MTKRTNERAPVDISGHLVEENDESETLAGIFGPGIEFAFCRRFDQSAEVGPDLLVQRRILAEPHHHRRRQGFGEPGGEETRDGGGGR